MLKNNNYKKELIKKLDNKEFDLYFSERKIYGDVYFFYLLAKATGLKSKKFRQIKKTAKKTFIQLLKDYVDNGDNI